MATRSLGALTIDLIARIGGFTAGMTEAERAADKSTREIARKNRERAKEVENAWSGIGKTISTAFAAIGLTAASAQYIQAADAVTVLQNQLKLATGSVKAASAAYEQLYEIAQRSRVSFTELGGTYSAIARAGSQLGVSQDRLLKVTEAIGNAMTISGGSAASMQAALIQLSQGLSSGTLRGEELNSVMEQTPRLAKALADGLGVPLGRLRDLGKAGEITAEQVIKALESQSGTLVKEVQGATLTVGQAFTQVQNAAVKFTGNLDSATGASGALAGALSSVAGALDSVGKAAKNHEVAITTVFGVLAGAGLAASLPSIVGGLKLVAGAVAAVGAVLAANPALLVLLGLTAAVGGAVAYNSAASKTADGIRRQIAGLEELNRTGMRGRGTEEERLAWIEKRNQQIKELRQELALLDNQNLDTSSEDRRFAALASQNTQQQALNAKLGETRNAINGVNKQYQEQQAQLQSLYEFRQAGLITEDEYLSSVKKINDALVKQYADRGKAAKESADADKKWAKTLEDDMKDALEWRKKQLDALNAVWDAVDKLDKQEAESTKGAREAYANLVDQNQQLKLEIDLIGRSEVARKAILRQKQQEVIADKELELLSAIYNNESAEKINLLEREIALRKENLQLTQNRDIAEANDAIRKSELAEWGKTWEQVSQSFTDSLIDGGKSVSEYLKGLFRTLVLRPVILAGVKGGMNSLGLGAQGAQAGGSLTGALGAGISSLGSAFGSTAIADFGMGMNIGSAALSQMGGVTGAASAGASFGGALPYIGWALAAISLIKKFDDSGTLHMGGGAAYSSATGAISGINSAQYTGFNLSADQYTSAANSQAAGIAKAVTGILDSVSKSFGGAGGYTVGTGFADDSSKDGAWGALRITKNGRVVSDWGMGEDRWPGREFSNGEAGQQEYSNAIASSIRDALKAETPAWAGVMMDALGETTTIEDLAQVVQQINAFNSSLTNLGIAMPQLATLTDEAVTHMIEAFGGTDGLVGATQSYFTSFYSEAEKFQANQRMLREQFSALNIAVPQSTASYRTLIEAQNLNTEAGRQTYASLVKLAPAFYEVASAVEAAFNSISATTAQSVRDIQMSVLGDAAKYQYLNDEIEGMLTKLSQATLPAEIQAMVEKINQSTIAAYNLLGDTEQQNLSSQFIDRLYEVEAIAQSRLSIAGDVADSMEAQAEAAQGAIEAAADMRAAADEMQSAATLARQAAERQWEAAQTTKTIQLVDQFGLRINSREVAFG